MQGAAEDPGACRLHLLLEDADPLHELPHLFLGHRVAGLALDAVDGQQVIRHGGPPRDGRALPDSHPNYERASARLTRTKKTCQRRRLDLGRRAEASLQVLELAEQGGVLTFELLVRLAGRLEHSERERA